jgi:alkyl sulfatase BDS1-like metallo-beta-lactamase superfamily hydrolase
LALDAEMIVPSHHSPIKGGDNIRLALTKIRDAVQYVHDETIRGMNEGKTVYELMKEIQLPPELELTQEHGKVSWAVKSIWEYYMGWFHFESTTELFPVPARDVYAEVAAMAGNETLVTAAQAHFQQGEPEKALHLLEMVLAAEPANRPALETRLSILEFMLERAIGEDGGNNYEKDYLRSRIAITEQSLAAQG